MTDLPSTARAEVYFTDKKPDGLAGLVLKLAIARR